MIKKLRSRLKGHVAAIALIAFAVGSLTTGIAVAVGVTQTATGNLSRFDAVAVSHPQDVEDPVCTTSTTYTDMPGMTKTFQVGGGLVGDEAIVSVQAQSVNNTTGGLSYGYIRLLIDDVVQEELAMFGSVGVSTYPLSNWDFVTNTLSPGTHTAKIQWKMDPGQDIGVPPEFCRQNRSMIILHR